LCGFWPKNSKKSHIDANNSGNTVRLEANNSSLESPDHVGQFELSSVSNTTIYSGRTLVL